MVCPGQQPSSPTPSLQPCAIGSLVVCLSLGSLDTILARMKTAETSGLFPLRIKGTPDSLFRYFYLCLPQHFLVIFGQLPVVRNRSEEIAMRSGEKILPLGSRQIQAEADDIYLSPSWLQGTSLTPGTFYRAKRRSGLVLPVAYCSCTSVSDNLGHISQIGDFSSNLEACFLFIPPPSLQNPLSLSRNAVEVPVLVLPFIQKPV